MSFTSQLTWRHAVKQYDSEKKVSAENLATIKEAMRFAPSSFGLQPIHIVHVTSPELRLKLKEAAYGQSQFDGASDIFVLCARTDLHERVEGYITVATGGDESKKASFEGFSTMVNGMIDHKPKESWLDWAARQTYIALGFGLAAAAELGVDSSPMEGFSPEQFHSILELPEYIQPVVLFCVGYRSAEDLPYPKVRFPENDYYSEK